jgi:hypothetical protein
MIPDDQPKDWAGIAGAVWQYKEISSKKHHFRTGELSPESVGCCGSRNQSEDGLKHFNRIAGAIKNIGG